MGPKTNYLTGDFKNEEYIWQDPIPMGKEMSVEKENAVRESIKNTGLNITSLIECAWASASTYRTSDKRGGANGSRIRLSPQKDWAVNHPKELQGALNIYKTIAEEHDVSVADVIVLGGSIGIEMACGHKVATSTGRGDALQEMTDVDSVSYTHLTLPTKA